jgi:hypothetical protein
MSALQIEFQQRLCTSYVELDGLTAVLVQAAGVVDGDGLSAAIVASVVVAELGVGGGLGNAEEGGNDADEDSGLHSVECHVNDGSTGFSSELEILLGSWLGGVDEDECREDWMMCC